MQNADNLRQVIGKKKIKKGNAPPSHANPIWLNINQVINRPPKPLLPTPRPQFRQTQPVARAAFNTVYRANKTPQAHLSAIEVLKNLNTQGPRFQVPDIKNITIAQKEENLINNESSNVALLGAHNPIFEIEESKPINTVEQASGRQDSVKKLLNDKQKKWLEYKDTLQQKKGVFTNKQTYNKQHVQDNPFASTEQMPQTNSSMQVIKPIDFNLLAAEPQQNNQGAQTYQQQGQAQQHIKDQQRRVFHQQNRVDHRMPPREPRWGSYPKGIPKSFLRSQTEPSPIMSTNPGREPVWVPREPTPPPSTSQLYNENVPGFDRQMLAQNVEETTQKPSAYSPSDMYADNSSYAKDEELPEDSESPDLLDPGQKRLSAFQRLGPQTQPKKPKLTINLLFNKEQSVREVVDSTEEPDPSKYKPVHLREDILSSADPTVSKYLDFWPWKCKVFLRKTVTARKSKSVMMIEQEQMEEFYARENLFLQVSVTGYPPCWNMEDVLDAVLYSVTGKSFIPCFIDFTERECKFFVIRCLPALVAIHKYGFVIHRDDVLLLVTVSQTEIYLKKLDFVPKFVLRKQMALDYDGEGKLSLKEFTLKKDVKHFIYFPLSRATNQAELVQLKSTITWNNLTELNLSHNKITSIAGFSLPTTTPKLKRLDLSHNLLERLTVLLTCRELSLLSVCLEGNPLCTDYTDPDHYVQVVRMMFPTIKEIDGVPIRIKDELVKSKKNFCPEEVTVIVEKFLDVYFPLLDSSIENRLSIQEMYDENACMTVTYNMKIRYSPVFRHFRNLFLRARVMEEGDTESIDGATAITKLISKWPAFEHDPFTFTVDAMFHNENVAIFRVGGILKLTAESLADDEYLLAFTRTFVLKTNDNIEYKIQNDMVYWDEPSTEYGNTAFQVTAVRPINLSLKLETTPDDDLKEKLLAIFMKLTDMERKPSEKCLEMKSWHLQHALEYFSKLLKLDSLESLY